MTFYLVKIDVNVHPKSNKAKNLRKKLFFVGILKATDEKCKIRIRQSKVQILIRILTKLSRIRNMHFLSYFIPAFNSSTLAAFPNPAFQGLTSGRNCLERMLFPELKQVNVVGIFFSISVKYFLTGTFKIVPLLDDTYFTQIRSCNLASYRRFLL
jgi:hypothetical protein